MRTVPTSGSLHDLVAGGAGLVVDSVGYLVRDDDHYVVLVHSMADEECDGLQIPTAAILEEEELYRPGAVPREEKKSRRNRNAVEQPPRTIGLPGRRLLSGATGR